MEGLFDKDPVMRMRDSKGRFATPERAYADKAIEDNKRLRLLCDKYKRAWLSCSKRVVMIENELKQLRIKISCL